MVKCSLCSQPISNYNPVFHHLKLDDSSGVDICQECVDKFFKWQGSIYSKLFPTKAMKKRFEKNK